MRVVSSKRCCMEVAPSCVANMTVMNMTVANMTAARLTRLCRGRLADSYRFVMRPERKICGPERLNLEFDTHAFEHRLPLLFDRRESCLFLVENRQAFAGQIDIGGAFRDHGHKLLTIGRQEFL